MKRTDIPANVTIMDLPASRLSALKPVRVLDIYDGGGNNFHEEGLFSVSIFGRLGSDERDTRFSYIDLHTTVMHPLIYKHLVKLKGLYKGIMAGKAYAVWDEKEKDFEPSDEINGKTGYSFFLKHWADIKFKRTNSDIRDMRIELIEKFKDKALTSKVLVLPAGLRDIQVDETGRTKEGEINPFYRTLISISNAISTSSDANSPILDNSRNSLQNAFNNVYDYINNLVEGKGGFLQSKWGARRIFNGTRNVITAMDTSPPMLGSPNAPKVNNTGIGLYQYIKGALPFAKHHFLNGWVRNVFNTAEGNATLINPVSLKRETVKVPADIVDRWTSSAGVEKIFNSFSEPSVRLKPIVIEEYYIGLVYRPKDRMVFKIFGDIDELPQGEQFSRGDVYPITLCELIYLCGYRIWNTRGMLVTRYPIAGVGSIYPSLPYVKTTIVGEMRAELGDTWEPIGDDYVALEYPSVDKPFFVDSLIPHPSRIKGMGADFDGDTASANIVYSDEAVQEIHDYLNSRVAYINPRGGLNASAGVETVQRVLQSMTGD